MDIGHLLSFSLYEGLAYGFVAIGVYITFRVLSFPDLTVDGSFPLGGAVAATLIVNGFNPWLATIAAMLAGVCAGLGTSLLNTKLRINALLSGILMMVALYSINLMI
ncbi:MAG: ABC transporter permease, partial [Dehalococcoidales bacterium]|nr:ABC transporter permease [Dehalococcoidales bacterium]